MRDKSLLTPEALRGLVHDDALSRMPELEILAQAASQMREKISANRISYSRKVFIPVTRLCRDVCHYCTFATAPRKLDAPFMSEAQVLELAHAGKRQGCKEALFTLGERPELRYRSARTALETLGYPSTLAYLAHLARRVVTETGLLPHINAGTMNGEEMDMLRPVSASMGIMLESSSERLCEKGMPHHGSPDKMPEQRLRTIALAGEKRIALTSGILIGIGETRVERMQALFELRDLHERYGHIQEVIVQNFRAKAGTKMAHHPEPSLEELLWTISVARLILPEQVSVQVPPNLNPGVLQQLLAAGINDWGGVSPLTPDYVNPEAPWPHLKDLSAQTAKASKVLCERLTIYPDWQTRDWLDADMLQPVRVLTDGSGFACAEDWRAGGERPPPANVLSLAALTPMRSQVSEVVRTAVAPACKGESLSETSIAQLFASRGADFSYLCRAADTLRRDVCGNRVGYVVNRNINYTNICTFHCEFCAFSKGRNGREKGDKPYNLSMQEIAARARQAWERGATEVCLQGGIHPKYSGTHYLDVCRTIRANVPHIHIHAFSPLEVKHGAESLGVSVEEFLQELRACGLNTLPGTAAEILDDEVRSIICPDKLNSAQWLEVIRTAHRIGLQTTATIMFGHVDGYRHWARHLLLLRALQEETGGITEMVPLPFVAAEAPLFLRGGSRPGPSFREVMLMHAISRLALHPLIKNIQTSWVKLGELGTQTCLRAGANDLGGTLMNESITRAAGAVHGQELDAERMRELIQEIGRRPWQRTTCYGSAPLPGVRAALDKNGAPSILARV
jgi:FO synthase